MNSERNDRKRLELLLGEWELLRTSWSDPQPDSNSNSNSNSELAAVRAAVMMEDLLAVPLSEAVPLSDADIDLAVLSDVAVVRRLLARHLDGS